MTPDTLSTAWILTGPTSQVRDTAFDARVAAESRALLATAATDALIPSLPASEEPRR